MTGIGEHVLVDGAFVLGSQADFVCVLMIFTCLFSLGMLRPFGWPRIVVTVYGRQLQSDKPYEILHRNALNLSQSMCTSTLGTDLCNRRVAVALETR